MYAGVADIVGGLQFRDKDGDLSGLTVGDAFFDFDGDRQNRIRYDTPVLGPGLQFSVSAGSDQRYDASLNWGGDFDQWSGVDFGPFTTLAAIGISDPSEKTTATPTISTSRGAGTRRSNGSAIPASASTSPVATTLRRRAISATRSGARSCRRSRTMVPSSTARYAGTAWTERMPRAWTTSWGKRRRTGQVLMRRRLTIPAILLAALALTSACVPIRAADPPRNNTEIPQGPGLFTGEAGELVILLR